MQQSPFISPTDIAQIRAQRPAIAIGNFDGLHRGHQVIFKELKSWANENDVPAMALTFEPHPIRQFKPQAPPHALQTLAEKTAVAKRYLDGLIIVDFSRVYQLSPETFFQQVIVDGLNASAVMVGHNFLFGKNRAGDVDTLRRLCESANIEFFVVDDVVDDQQELISSTRIRNELRKGNIAEVNRLLGHPWRLAGRVIHGDKIGTTLGFPTANIETPTDRLFPPDGIYAAYLVVKDVKYEAAAYIGPRPTFDTTDFRIEAFVIDAPPQFSIYESEVDLEFIASIREDRRFDSTEELVAAMKNDVEQARRILHKNQ